jgi:hypothetical protein
MQSLGKERRILDLVAKTYSWQMELKEQLDGKLNNFVTVTATVSTLSVGIAIFVLDKISANNPYYIPVIGSFFTYLCLFACAMVMGLLAYKPTRYAWYPDDPERLIEEYLDFQNEVQVIAVIASSFAHVANLNKGLNAKKSKACKRIFWLLIGGLIMMLVFSLFMVIALRTHMPVDP